MSTVKSKKLLHKISEEKNILVKPRTQWELLASQLVKQGWEDKIQDTLARCWKTITAKKFEYKFSVRTRLRSAQTRLNKDQDNLDCAREQQY